MTSAPADLANVHTLPQLLAYRAASTPDAEAYRAYDNATQAWSSLTWAQARERVGLWTRALAAMGLPTGARVAILLPNGLDAMSIDQATLAHACVPVPLHAIDNPGSIAYILSDCEASLLVLEDTEQWQRIQAVGTPLPQLKGVVLTRPGARSEATAPVPVIALTDWLARATRHAPLQTPPCAADLAAIVYTSGTTGKPKGVMLTHANVMADVSAFLQRIQPTQDDRFLSFLPLSHTFERTVGYYLAIASGACTSYARSAALLMQDMQTEKPTILVCVPRIYERVHAKMVEKMLAGPAEERQAFEAAVEWGWANFCARQQIGELHKHDAALIGTPAPAAHAALSQQIAQMFGGCVRMAITGGAAMPQSTARAFLALDVPLLQGYGMTETTPVISVVTLDSNDPATVGEPLSGVEVRIGEQHELQVRGPIVMKGYWKRPEETADVFTADGWLRTGDQAEMVKGRIRLLGRLKEIIVTSTGEKISPADLESSLLADPLIEQIMVLGDHRPYISAIAVLNAENWPLFARDNGWDSANPETLRQPVVVQTILKRLQALSQDFPSYAQPRALLLTLAPWSVENQLLTPTMKVKRKPILAHYDSEIESIYGNRRIG